MTVYEMAVYYLERGFSVIALRPKDKKPLGSWKEFQDRRATPDEIKEWFDGTDSNIGIVTGKISGITVIDCDTIEAVSKAAELGLPTCPTVKTGKGYHFYYAYADGVRNFQKRDDLPGIDLRGDGGFVVAPPSIHPNGKIYDWEGITRELPPLPKWVVAKKSEKTSMPELFKGASPGSRNDTLARLAGVWCKLSKSLPDVLEMARAWNTLNSPPLPLDEVERTVVSIFTREKSKPEDGPAKPTTGELIRVASLKDKIEKIYEEGLKGGEKTGWETLDPHYTVRKGELTIITGIPGSGKTTWLDALLMNLSSMHGWKFGMFSAENLPFERHIASLAEQYTGMPFSEGPTDRMKAVHIQAAIEFLDDHLTFIMPKDGNRSVHGILALSRALNDLRNIDGLVIDPWNEIDHSRPGGMSETEHTSLMLTKIRETAREIDVHIWLVAHPAKLYKNEKGNYPIPTPYDISGSANFRNKADNCITVWRDFSKNTGEVEIHIQKIRFREVGMLGSVRLFYDRITGRYHQSEMDRF